MAPETWVTSQAMPYINQSLRQAGFSSSVADKLNRAAGLLAAQGVLQVTHSADPEPGDGWAGMQAVALPFSAAPIKFTPKPGVLQVKAGGQSGPYTPSSPHPSTLPSRTSRAMVVMLAP